MMFLVFVTITFSLFLFVYARYMRANADVQGRKGRIEMRERRVDRMVETLNAGNARLRERIRDTDNRIENAGNLLKHKRS